MANYTNLKQSVKNAIKNNGRQDITGDGMQAVLLSIIGSVGQYATFAGIADPSTNPGTQDGNVFYIATKSGVYPNFGGLEVKYGGLSIFENSTGSWLKKDISTETLPNVFDGNKVNNIVKEGGFSDVFVINGQTVDPKTGDLLYNADGIYGKWGVITDIHLEGKQLYIKYIWDGYVNTIMIDENGDAARYVNRYKTPKVYDAKSVLSASSAGNMQDYFLIKDPDNSTEYFFEFWQVGDLILNENGRGGLIVSDSVEDSTATGTLVYIYGWDVVTITYRAQSPAKILSVSRAKIGSPTDAANASGSIYARIAAADNELLMRKIYTSYGAVYNSESNTYTLNEVTLTPEEMYDIYVNQNMWNVRENIISWCNYPYKPKTNIPPHQSLSSEALGCRCVFVAYINDSLETFKLSQRASDTNENGWLITSFDYAFQGCKNLRKIIGVIQFGSIVKLSQNNLKALPALEDARFKFAQDAWIKDSPKLSYDSVKFMAEKSTNVSKAITISLHADVFAKLSGTASDDAYTQSGHTKEEWMALVTTAQGRNVSFAEAV